MDIDIQKELKYFTHQYNQLGNIKLVVVLHPVLGYTIRPMLIIKENPATGNFLWFNQQDFEKLKIPKSELFFKLMDHIFQYSEEIIKKKYCKDKHIKTYDFIKSLEPDFIKTHVRPYIELYLLKVIQLIVDNKIPLYLHDNRLNTLPEKTIHITTNFSEVVYNFIRTENETQYFITLSHENKQIQLYQSRGVVLCNKPCWVIVDNKLFRLTDDVDGAKLLPFLNKSHISVPKQAEEKYYATFIFNAIKKSKVIAKGFEVMEKNPKPLPILQLTMDWQNTFVFVLSFKYDDWVLPSHEPLLWKTEFIMEKGNFRYIKTHRNLEVEQQFIAFLNDNQLIWKEGSAYVINKSNNYGMPVFSLKHEMLNWLNFHHQELLQFQTVIQVSLDNKSNYFTGKIECLFVAKKRMDWFDVNVKVQFGDYTFHFLELKDFILNDIPEIKLPDGSIAVIPAEWFSRLKEVFLFAKTDNGEYKIARYHYELINQLTGLQSNTIKAEVEDIHQLLVQTKAAVPQTLHANLRPYQILGFQWLNFLFNNHFGGCLADDMGLGKTLQVIALLCEIKENRKNMLYPKDMKIEASGQLNLFSEEVVLEKTIPSLVVVPLSLVHNWNSEVQKFAPHLKTLIYYGSARQQKTEMFFDVDLIITTYGTLRNDIELMVNFKFFYVILDESQNIKNPHSKNFLAAIQLQAYHRLVITGTPVENKITDLWAQMAFVNPGLLGSHSFFQKEFVQRIENAKTTKQHLQLKKLIHPFVLRRSKQEVAPDLPELTEIIHYCEMDEAQALLYEKIKSKYRNELAQLYTQGTIKNNTAYVLKGLLELRLLANHPQLHPEGKELPSGKYDEITFNLLKVVEEGHKVLIFSQFVKHLQIYQHFCEENKLLYCMLTGQQNEATRKRMIKEFQEDESKQLFLISLKAGGVGLNLTAASYVFIADPWWNPAAELQAINRAHRIGQHNKVLAYRYITKNSIEEKIMILQQKKQKLADIIVQHSNPFQLFDEKTILSFFE